MAIHAFMLNCHIIGSDAVFYPFRANGFCELCMNRGFYLDITVKINIQLCEIICSCFEGWCFLFIILSKEMFKKISAFIIDPSHQH